MSTPADAPALLERYRAVREWTERICSLLQLEDQVIQSMPDVSPTRWHIAHTTWFFETFVLAKALPSHKPVHREKHLILVPYLYANGAEINGLEMPVNAGKKRKRRTLSDYGLKFPDEDAKD